MSELGDNIPPIRTAGPSVLIHTKEVFVVRVHRPGLNGYDTFPHVNEEENLIPLLNEKMNREQQ
jgi:hypothetical protein